MEGGLADRLEVEALVGIEIENQPVGFLDILDPGTPPVEFDRPHLDAGQQPIGRIDEQIGFRAPVQTVRELAVTWARTSFVKRWSWAQIFLSYCRGGALVALWWLQGEAIERCAADLASLIRPVRP